ncbi:MAG: hypothetical protein F6K00_31625 [Leptolyngbya sp. SIOISBB]|nr:hypothetical protein [Leptolyngbya sp. SIOISBB]
MKKLRLYIFATSPFPDVYINIISHCYEYFENLDGVVLISLSLEKFSNAKQIDFLNDLSNKIQKQIHCLCEGKYCILQSGSNEVKDISISAEDRQLYAGLVNLEFGFEALFVDDIEEYIKQIIQLDFFSYIFDVTAIGKDYIIPVYKSLTQNNVSAVYSFRLLSAHRTFDDRELIHNLENHQTYTYARVVDYEYENKIIKSINFPPEYQQAGMAILTYF